MPVDRIQRVLQAVADYLDKGYARTEKAPQIVNRSERKGYYDPEVRYGRFLLPETLTADNPG